MSNRIALVFPGMDVAAEPNIATSEHLGSGYLAAVLRQNNYEVIIINAEIERLSPDKVTQRILEYRPFLAGFSPVSLSISNTLLIIKELKKADSDIKTVLGGHLATMSGLEILQNESSVDYVLKGDAEYSILDLLNALQNTPIAPDHVPGLVFRKPDQTVSENPYTPGIVDLDKIPRCERDDLSHLARQKDFDFCARISASRGCNHDCSFCTNRAVYGKTIRFRKVIDVKDEMEFLNRQFQVRHFWFNDDLFINGTPANTKWVENFTDTLLKTNSSCTYRILCRADSFNHKNIFLLDKLVASGLSHIYFGIESGSQHSLDVYNKRITVKQNKEAISIIKSKNIELTLGFIMFNPYSSFQDIEESTLFLYEQNELFRIFPLTNSLSVYPHTPIAKKLAGDKLLISESYKDPLTCYRYKDERIGFLAGRMYDYYNETFEMESFINKQIKGPGKQSSARLIKLQNDLNTLNKENFLILCSRLQNNTGTSGDYIQAHFNEWTSAKRKILSDYMDESH